MNFKKTTTLFLVFLILVSNIGLAFNVHYCKDKVVLISFQIYSQGTYAEKRCCNKNTVKKVSCCDKKVINFQKKTDDVAFKSFSFSKEMVYMPFDERVKLSGLKRAFISIPIIAYHCEANAPPLFKLYHQYVLYY